MINKKGLTDKILILYTVFLITAMLYFVAMLLIGDLTQAYVWMGIVATLSVIVGLILAPNLIKEKLEIIGEKVLRIKETVAVEDLIPFGSLVAMKPTRLKLRIKNPLDTFGLRLRFRSYDYINPSTLSLLLEPGEKTETEVIMVPSGGGKREFSISIAPLYNEEDKLIPDHEADDVALQKFFVEVEEPVVGGLSSRERSIISGLIKFAAFFSASGLVYLSILRISGLESLIFVLTQVLPVVVILQVPVLMLMFYLEGKLPEKPTFVFEEE